MVVLGAALLPGCAFAAQVELDDACLGGERPPNTPGTADVLVDDGILARAVRVFVPESAPADRSLGLVIDLVPATEDDVETWAAVSNFETVAEEEGFVVATIASSRDTHQWNVRQVPAGPDDVAVIDAAADAVAAIACIDEDQVHVAGFSDAGRMASLAACGLAGRIASIATVAGLDDPNPCRPDEPLSVAAFHGEDDVVAPLAGRSGEPTPAEVARAWAVRNGCELGDAQEGRDGGHLYDRCDEDVVVVFAVVPDAGHAWPGIEITRATWDFFRANPRRPVL
ncbi:MAG: PHB depolymerase family esterase [Actinomycetota bacterium]|nr:PHB depolymerase family esterase [Actinomycetota bacterium]